MAFSMPGGGGGGRRRRGARAPIADINVTPFVDVMLVLLIIFMVTAPLLVTGVPVQLPESRAAPVAAEEQEPVQLTLNRAGALFLGDTEIAPATLPDRLAAIALENQGLEQPRQIMLRADAGLDYGRVMAVMGEINRAGLTRIALVTTSSDAPQ